MNRRRAPDLVHRGTGNSADRRDPVHRSFPVQGVLPALPDPRSICAEKRAVPHFGESAVTNSTFNTPYWAEDTLMMMNNKPYNAVYLPLRLTFGLVPIVAGLDKFTNILADWSAYLPSFAADLLPMPAGTFMLIVGGIEVIAGVAVLAGITRLGAYVVMAWLLLLAVNVGAAGYLDIAVRDVVMAIAAFTLGQVATWRGEAWIPSFARTSNNGQAHVATN